MSRTNCFLPNSGFVLNFRVRMVNSLIAPKAGGGAVDGWGRSGAGKALP